MTDIRTMLNRAENREEDIRVELWELDAFGMDPTGMDLMLVVRLKSQTLSFVFEKQLGDCIQQTLETSMSRDLQEHPTRNCI